MLNRLLLPVSGQSVLFTPNSRSPGEYTIAPPDIVTEKLNMEFQFDARIGQFFTIIYGVLDIRTRIVEYVCAGHPPLIYLPHNKESVIINSSQFPIGVVASPQYKKESIQLHPGDRLILYTDGLIEALDLKDEPFTIERLAKQFQDMHSMPLIHAVAQAIAVVENWCLHTGIKDDLSILAIEADINYKQ
jgi:sigma-B regulation protein RsbU (phosphoserine phosphatase)